MGAGHGPVTAAEVVSAGSRRAPRRHFQHLQRRFARGGETRATSQKKHAAEAGSTSLGQGPEMIAQQSGGSAAESVTHRAIASGFIDYPQKTRCYHQICKTAGHDPASAV